MIYYEFEKYDKSKQFRPIVNELVRLVSRHTLSIELLAKGANCLDYKNGLDDYLSDLKQHGFGFPDFDFISVHTKHNNFES